MRKIGLAVVLSVSALALSARTSARSFVITDYGAKEDGSKVTAAFAAAMSAAADAGGGRVVVPDGRWFTGPIHFRSNCELHLSEGATVVFSQEPKDYLPAVPVSWEGIECWNYSPLVYAYCCTNIAITGKGTLRAFDGVFKDSFWKKWASAALVRPTRRQLYDWGATDYPVEKRRMTELERPFLRPHFVHFNRCSGIRLEDFRVRESPFWTLHLYHSENAVVRGLDVSGRAWNNDGIDIEMTRNVLVERCSFNQGDDCFVLKAGRNRDAWRAGQPTENVEIRDCHIARATSFFTCGSEISGGIRNVWMHDCSVGECGRLCHVKTNRRRGAFIEGVRMENVTAKKAGRLLGVDTDAMYEWARFPDYELKTTRIGDISLRNVRVDEAMTRLDVQGDAKLPVRGIRLENVTAGVTRTGDRLVNVEDVVEDGRALPTAREFGIADFGATHEDATEGIARAITAAAEAGCGRVIVPAGEWRSGPIDLLSGVELCVPSNAKILMRDDPALYRTEDGGYRPLVRAKGAHDVRLSSGFWGIVEALTDGWQAVEPAKRPPLVGFQDCTNVVVDTIALHNTPSVVLVAERTRRLAVSSVEFIAPVEPDGFIVLRDSEDASVSGNSYRIGDGRIPPEDPRHRVVEAVVGPKPSARYIPVSTREAPLGVDGAGLETVSGNVRLESMDAEYDPLSDTLVKFDGAAPVTNEHYLARRYDCALAPLNAEGVFRTPPVGWMTWYSVKFDASETMILENAKAFKEAFGGYTDEKPVLWVDWEWFHRKFNSKGEDGEDMLSPHKASYPRGLKALASDLKGLGFTPALWVSPQVDVRTNALFAAHPEWILASHSFWGGHVFADPTAPGYLDDFVKPLFRKYRSWGYEAFKWDCMPYTMWMYDLYHDRFHDKSVSTKEAYRRLVAAGREAVGPDTYLESCSGTGDDPMLWSADAFDAARVGSDIFAWSSFASEGVDMLLRYYPLHNLFLRCDADNLVLREEFNTLEQARTRVTIYALTGVPITVGDRIDALDAPRIEMLRKAMPVVPMRPASLRPYFRKGNVLSLTAHFARDWGRWQVKSWSNLSTAVTEHVSFEVPAGHACWDVWNERLVTATDGKIEFELGPGASRVFRLTPLEAKGPTLLGTTRHLTQGGYELESYAATEKGATWRHKLTDRGDERLFLLYDNDVVSVPARTGSWKVEVP